MACALLKDLHLGEDLKGEKNQLCYIRDREKREVDFLTLRDKKIESLIEVKLSDDNFSKSLNYFQERLKAKHSLQVVLNLKQNKSTPNITMIRADEFLITLEDIIP